MVTSTSGDKTEGVFGWVGWNKVWYPIGDGSELHRPRVGGMFYDWLVAKILAGRGSNSPQKALKRDDNANLLTSLSISELEG
jgi:hypothetical protein